MLPPEPAFMDFEGLRLRIVAGDPGLVRLTLALRAVLTILVGILLTRALPQPHPLAATVGIYLSLLLGLMVNDPLPGRRKGTLWLCGLASIASFSLGVGLIAWPWLSNLFFVLLAGLSHYLGKFGFRYGSLGLMSFFGFLMARIFPVPAAGLPVMTTAILVGTALAYVLRFWWLPDRPERILRWTYLAFQARCQLQRRQPSVRGLARLNEAALALDDQLRVLQAEELRRQLFQAELRLGQWTEARLTGQPEPEIESFDCPLPEVPPGTLLDVITYRGAGLPERLGVLAAQAILAVSLALWLGQSLAPDHWYWCAMASYMVFMQVRTLGDSLVRAFSRLAGTGMGLILGLLAGASLPLAGALPLVAILLCLFAGYYMSRISVFWMLLFNTTAISLLYTLLGQDAPQLMQLRLGMTLLGSLLGSLVALLVVPVRTAQKARSQASQVLEQILRLEDGGQLPELRAIDHLVFNLRRIGSSGSLLPMRLPETARLVRATAHLAYASRHYMIHRDEHWRERVRRSADEVRARLS